MLSAIVLACDAAEPRPAAPEAVVASIAALVAAVIAGLVGEASLAVTTGDIAMQEIADHAGCRLVETTRAADVLATAIATARGPRLLVLRAGCVPEHGFVEELADVLRADPAGGALLRQTPARGLARLIASLAPAAGLVGAQSLMLESGRQNLADLARAIRPARVFRCTALRIG